MALMFQIIVFNIEFINVLYERIIYVKKSTRSLMNRSPSVNNVLKAL